MRFFRLDTLELACPGLTRSHDGSPSPADGAPAAILDLILSTWLELGTFRAAIIGGARIVHSEQEERSTPCLLTIHHNPISHTLAL